MNELSEVNAVFRFEVEDGLVPIEEELDRHRMHVELLFGNHLLEHRKRFFGFCLHFLPGKLVFDGGLALHRLQRALQVLDGLLVDLFQVFVGYTVFQSTFGAYDERIARTKFDPVWIEPQNLGIIGKPDRSNVRHTVPLLSQKA